MAPSRVRAVLRARLIAAGVCAGVYIAGDMTWVTLTSGPIYRPVLGHLMADRIDVGAAVAFYIVYLVGMLTFAIAPCLHAVAWRPALWRGALLGLVAYGTYDLTNQGTLRNWSVNVSLIDMVWGAVITGLASAAGCAAASLTDRRQVSVAGPAR